MQKRQSLWVLCLLAQDIGRTSKSDLKSDGLGIPSHILSLTVIADERGVRNRRASGAVRRVAMIADDRHIPVVAESRWAAMIANDRRITMIADHDLAIAAARVDRTHNRRRIAWTTRFGMRIDDFAESAMVTDDWRVTVVANDGRTPVVSYDGRVAVISNDRWSAMIAYDGRVCDAHTALAA
jgi:hypothetical protein